MDAQQIVAYVSSIIAVSVVVIGGLGLIARAVIREWNKTQAAVIISRTELTLATQANTVATKQTAIDVPAKLNEFLAPLLSLYVDRTNEMNSRIDLLTAEHGKTKQDLLDANNERQTLATELTKVQKHADDLDTMVRARDERIASLEREIHETQAALERVRSDKDSQLIEANRTIADLQTQLDKAQAETDKTKAEMGKLQDRVEVLEGQVANMLAERADLMKQLEAITKERDDLIARAEAAERLAADLQAALDAKQTAGITSADPVIVASTEAKG